VVDRGACSNDSYCQTIGRAFHLEDMPYCTGSRIKCSDASGSTPCCIQDIAVLVKCHECRFSREMSCTNRLPCFSEDYCHLSQPWLGDVQKTPIEAE